MKQYYAHTAPLILLNLVLLILLFCPIPAPARLLAVLLLLPTAAFGGYITYKWSQVHSARRDAIAENNRHGPRGIDERGSTDVKTVVLTTFFSLASLAVMIWRFN